MSNIVRIGNAHGFWGDRLGAAAELLSYEPKLDYLTLDFLAEVSMSIMASQQRRDPSTGYALDFLQIVQSLVPYWRNGGRCRVVTNAGGLNPHTCAAQCGAILSRAGCPHIEIAVVEGDNVVETMRSDAVARRELDGWRNLDTGESVDTVIDHVLTANAYLGAEAVRTALDLGADLVITGRVADPSLTVGPCMHHFGWNRDDYDRIAGATIAGHLIECGTQVTGGISTDWTTISDVNRIGFPIVEVAADGSCVVTKASESGGVVDEATVKEQLLYEIGDPALYLSPDVTVSFSSVEVQRESTNRVHVHGARGRAPPSTYKVSATCHRGYWSAGQLTIVGRDAGRKATRAGDAVLSALRRDGYEPEHQLIETLGDPDWQVVLRVAVADPRREAVEAFTRGVMPLITAGPPGTTGYAEGRPRVHRWIGFWPCLIDRSRVTIDGRLLEAYELASEAFTTPDLPVAEVRSAAIESDQSQPDCAEPTGTLIDIATARSGDKGIHANIGVIARRESDYPWLRCVLTTDLVAEVLNVAESSVQRYELPNLFALNFVIRGALSNPLRTDAQGKTLAQVLLAVPSERLNEG